MGAKVKALIWEEFRVGGVIASMCALAAVLCLATLRSNYTALRADDALVLYIAIGAPLLIALLLVLNPNQSGHLIGGFSKRVLWLPVPTSVAVAVTLAMRTLFVFAASVAILGWYQWLFAGAPKLTLALAFVMLYLLAQVLDWLRQPVSGLLSLLIAAAPCAALFALSTHFGDLKSLTVNTPANWRAAVLLTAGFAMPAYGISVLAVHCARVGLGTGIPEIWEWPRRLDFKRVGALRAFASPLGAQIWYELRQAGLALPVVTFGLWLLASAATWLYFGSTAVEWQAEHGLGMVSLLLFPSFLLGAAAHGIRSRVLGFRSTVGKAGFQYLQPLTSVDMAWAKTLGNLAAIAPMVAAVLVLHVWLAGGTFLSQAVPFAYESGAASLREIVWTLLDRGILIGLLAWPLTAIGTRVIRYVVLFVLAAPLAALGLIGMGAIGAIQNDEQKAFEFATWLVLVS